MTRFALLVYCGMSIYLNNFAEYKRNVCSIPFDFKQHEACAQALRQHAWRKMCDCTTKSFMVSTSVRVISMYCVVVHIPALNVIVCTLCFPYNYVAWLCCPHASQSGYLLHKTTNAEPEGRAAALRE